MVLFTRQKYLSRQSLAQGELVWEKKSSSLKVSLFINLHFLRNKAWRKPGLIFMSLNCLKCDFSPLLFFWKQAVNTFDFTLASFLQWSSNQCVLFCLRFQVLLQADFWRLCQRKSIVFLKCWQADSTIPRTAYEERGKNARLLNCNSSSSFWPYERNTLCWHNYCSWSSQLRAADLSLNS